MFAVRTGIMYNIILHIICYYICTQWHIIHVLPTYRDIFDTK